MCDSQKVVTKGGTGEIIEKKSRFIAAIYPITTEKEAMEHIALVRKKHYDARHNCFAYVIGDNNETERCSDDGEPSGTAGRPILDVINGQRLHNILVVVTRYFGGTLLGTGGLVRAYSSAVKAGLQECEIREKIRGYRLQITTDYNGMGKIRYAAAEREIVEEDTVYGEMVQLTYLAPRDKKDMFVSEVTEKTGGQALVDEGEEIWIYLNI